MGQQQRHGPVQAEAGAQLEGEGIQVIEAVGFPVSVGAEGLRLRHPTGKEKGADANDLVSLSRRSSACSGTPYTWLKPWKQTSAPTLPGPAGKDGKEDRTQEGQLCSGLGWSRSPDAYKPLALMSTNPLKVSFHSGLVRPCSNCQM